VTNQLIEAISSAADNGKPLVWLDAEGYCSRVLLNDKTIPWTNTAEVVSIFGQIQGLLKADVAPVHLGNFLRAWLAANTIALAEMRGKKQARFAVKRLLGVEALRQLVHETVSSLCGSLSQSVVLVLPPNRELISWVNHETNGMGFNVITDMDVDSVSVYLADFLRIFSELDVAGVLLQLPEGTAVNPRLLELYSPIINVTRHYKWAFGMEVSAPGEVNDPEKQLQYIITDDVQSCSTGLVQTRAFWDTGTVKWEVPHFVYAEVPPGLQPELVLERLASLKG